MTDSTPRTTIRRLAWIAALAAAGCGSPQTQPTSASIAQPRSAMASGSGVRLHYLDFGGNGTPVVLLAGAGNTAWIYSDVGRELARKHRVVALTRRGHGESDMPKARYDPATLNADLIAFLDEMKLERVVLVGHSLAGVELTYAATHQPERFAALVYLDAAYDRSVQGPVMEAEPYVAPEATDADRASIDAFMTYVLGTRPAFQRYAKDVVERDLRASIALREDGKAGWKSASIFGEYWTAASKSAPDYEPIKAPILAIYAISAVADIVPTNASAEIREAQQRYEDGPIANWRKHSIDQLRRAQPTAKIIEVKASHHVFLDRPAETLEAIESFLQR